MIANKCLADSKRRVYS